MKTIISISCLLVLACALSIEARPKRSVYYTPGVAIASVPVVRTHSVVHDDPTTVVKTEQVHQNGHVLHSSYSQEVKSNPHVHTHQTVAHQTVAAAAPVVATAPVVAAAPAYYNYPYYGYSHAYYHPYSYVVGNEQCEKLNRRKKNGKEWAFIFARL